ncbi:MAG: hypothetical protein V1774_09205 [Candidatus Eisenbacteria bacterium]
MPPTGRPAPAPSRRWSFRALLADVDRRVIFLVIGAAVALPLIFPLHLPIRISREAIAYHAAIEALAPDDVVLYSFDYEPDVMAELDPMSYATLRHLFRRNVRVVALTNYAGGTGIGERILRETAAEFGKTYGTDYVFLGYNPDYSATMLRMGESIARTFPTDHYRTPTVELPLVQATANYADIALIVSISGSALAEYWVIFAGGTYGRKVIAGNTAIQAVLIYPYFQTGQLSGFLGGLKGAAEYEKLIGREGAGVRGMDAQSMAHLLIVCFIVLGNVGYFLQRRKGGTDRAGAPDAREP